MIQRNSFKTDGATGHRTVPGKMATKERLRPAAMLPSFLKSRKFINNSFKPTNTLQIEQKKANHSKHMS